MVLFTGEYRPTLDEKGRIALPTRLRRKKNLAESREIEIAEWVFTYGYDHCIMGMPSETWQKFVQEKIAVLPKSVKENRQKARLLLSGAYECELDKQGRFILPNNLRQYASLSSNVVIIGVGDYIEIWEDSKYSLELPLEGESMNRIADEFWN